MGLYLNPGNSGFAGIRNDIYVDKSGLISLINETIETPRRLTCVSRPRRFGKSFACVHIMIKPVIWNYGGDILLVGINYDKNAPSGRRKHTCVIERYFEAP